MDADHATLGHTTAWTNALARRADHVSVITMVAGRIAVEPNVTVYSLGKELGRSEPRRLLTYYRLVHTGFSPSARSTHASPTWRRCSPPCLRLRELAERLGRGARETARDLEGTPDRYAASVRRLVEQVLAET